ncbi:biotin carboxyl carrier protein of acetyl-CoA carboxylase 1 [Pyrus ussuriensis x Pyrus communis]|uniref:Biotin carboxyl carrier protein of acetyl-CoA carboxylase 1 n=1 Tax=Pyrus ussuriensis x Pyrus communis TaxID=2448454 RepID=A0A5N5HBE7_9ROSA|nr:biotin carboxyl carrier protein of acetyl-CoA carboxylase 1 [Pyrus ussuriensis x Pyrus communis]
MASSSLGTLNAKITNLNFGKARVGVLKSYGVRSWTGRKPQLYSCLSISRQPEKALHVRSIPSLETLSATSLEEVPEESGDSGPTNQLIQNFDEVQSLLTAICDTPTVAEVKVKIGGFRLNVVRQLTEKFSTPPPPSPTPVSASENTKALDSMALQVSSSRSIQTLVDRATDDGLVLIRSPRVGLFRRSRTIKGKRAPPSCKEKQTVKEGQVICYIEQLGGELPIESDVAGEVSRILREDGDPVGYGDALVAVLPSFPGIMKLQ